MTDLQDLHAAVIEADLDADAARTRFRAAIREARAAGRSLRDIASELGLHHSRIDVMCKGTVEVHRPPRPRPAESNLERELRRARELG